MQYVTLNWIFMKEKYATKDITGSFDKIGSTGGRSPYHTTVKFPEVVTAVDI